jgi:phage terminase large subunit-like protein
VRQVIILKARQLGLSWLVIAYAVWLCLFHRNQTVLVFSKDQDSANEIVRRAGVIYKHLKNKPVAIATDNITQLAFENGSRIKSFAATEDAGSSFTASLIILDEFAKMHYSDQLYTSVKPTINDGGRMVIISTAKGEGNPFHKLWTDAVAGINALKPIFIPWNARPDRNGEWYVRAEASAISSSAHKQEYPTTADEAFSLFGEESFLPNMALWDALKEDLPPLSRNETMILGVDAAIGRANSFSDCFAIVGVTRHPKRHNDAAIRFVQKWQAKPGQQISYDGTEDAPGPIRVIRQLARDFSVLQVACDPARLDYVIQVMRGEVWFEAISQQSGSEKRPGRYIFDKLFYDLIIQKRLAHDGNVELREHIRNADRKIDQMDKHLSIIKRTESLKIDLCVAAAMACPEILRLNI